MEFKTLIYQKGDAVYRGSANRNQAITKQMWFAPDPESAKIYGYVYEYRFKQPVSLIRMDDPGNIGILYNIAKERKRKEVLDALSDSFQIVDGEIIRNSESDQDRLILNFICTELGQQGFASTPIKKDAEGTVFFHAEIGLCDAREYIEQVGILDMKVGVETHAYKLKQARAKGKAKARRPVYSDDDDDSPKLSRRLF